MKPTQAIKIGECLMKRCARKLFILMNLESCCLDNISSCRFQDNKSGVSAAFVFELQQVLSDK